MEVKTRFGAKIEDIKSSADLFFLESFALANQKDEFDAGLLFDKTNDIKAVDKFFKDRYNARLAEKYKKDANLSKRFKTRTFENYIVENNMQKSAYDKALNYAENIEKHIEKGTNIIFIGGGSVGTGKTHLACAIANKVLNKGIPVKVLSVVSLVDELKEFNPAYKRELKTVKVLLIDDLGKENGTLWLCSEIYGIINARYESELPTIITTEGTLSDLENNYVVECNGVVVNKGRSMISRLAESCFGVQMQGEDYRTKRGATC